MKKMPKDFADRKSKIFGTSQSFVDGLLNNITISMQIHVKTKALTT